MVMVTFLQQITKSSTYDTRPIKVILEQEKRTILMQYQKSCHRKLKYAMLKSHHSLSESRNHQWYVFSSRGEMIRSATLRKLKANLKKTCFSTGKLLASFVSLHYGNRRKTESHLLAPSLWPPCSPHPPSSISPPGSGLHTKLQEQ